MMKRNISSAPAIVMMVVLLAAVPLRAEGAQNDFQTIQKAVKASPGGQPGKEVRWFKVLVTDGTSDVPKIRITLPIALVEMVMNCSKKGPLTVGDDDCEIDLKALWAELKKAGPMALVEIEEDGAIIKVWLE